MTLTEYIVTVIVEPARTGKSVPVKACIKACDSFDDALIMLAREQEDVLGKILGRKVEVRLE